jgi:hypothetical protein
MYYGLAVRLLAAIEGAAASEAAANVHANGHANGNGESPTPILVNTICMYVCSICVYMYAQCGAAKRLDTPFVLEQACKHSSHSSVCSFTLCM